MVELRRRFGKFVEDVKRRIPVEAKNFDDFSRLVQENGVFRVSAEVFTHYSFMDSPFVFDGFVYHDSADATVYQGISASGRGIIHKEYYNLREEKDPQKAIMRALVTADTRLQELQKLTPYLKVAIDGHGVDMSPTLLGRLRSIKEDFAIQPYPKKIDDRVSSLFLPR
jgi:hypothetical protein